MYTVFSSTAFVVTPFLSIREASLLLGAGIYGIENLSDAVAGLPASGAVIAVMPLEAAAPPQEWLRSATKDSKRRIE